MLRNLHRYQQEAGTDGALDGAAPTVTPEAATPTVEELMAKIGLLEESNGKILGKNTELLGEKKDAQKRQAEEESARKAAELEAQRKSGDLEAFEKSLTEQFGTKETGYTTEIGRLNTMILGGKKNELIANLASEFVSPEVAKLMLGNLITTEHGENDTISTSFKGLDGQLVTTDPKAFKEYLQNTEAFAPYLNGVNSSGGLSSAAKPAASGGNVPMNDKQARIAAINKKFK